MKKRKKFHLDIRIVVSLFLVSVLVISGIWMIVTGVKEMSETKRETKGYEVVEGYFYDYMLEEEGGYDAVRDKHTAATYKLIYTYNVNGIDYTVVSDYSTSVLPSQGSAKNICYNPENPSDAFIQGSTSYVMMIAMGLFFAGVPLLIISAIVIPMKVKTKFEITGMIFGFTAAAVGYGALGVMAGAFSPVAIGKHFISSFSFLMLIPLGIMIAGIYLFIKSLFVRHTDLDDDNADSEYDEDEYGDEYDDRYSESEEEYTVPEREYRDYTLPEKEVKTSSKAKSYSAPKQRANPRGIIAAAIVIALAVFLSIGIRYARTAQYKDYVSTQGVITRIDMRYSSGNSSDGNHTIYFTYTVDGTEYSGANSYSGKNTDFYEGQTVEVWYDPDNPEESSFHKPGPGLDPYVPLFFCIPVAGVAYRMASGRRYYGY